MQLEGMTNDHSRQPNTFRASESETAKPRPVVQYGRVVGGGSVHFTANYWRFHEIDFLERSRKGAGGGHRSGRLAGHLRRAGAVLHPGGVGDRRLGRGRRRVRSTRRAAGRTPSRRCRPSRSGVLAERGAQKLGWHAFPAPMAILSQPYQGRAACIQCGFCMYYGCEVRAKSSTLATMIPEAEATGTLRDPSAQLRPEDRAGPAGPRHRSEVLRLRRSGRSSSARGRSCCRPTARRHRGSC